MADFFSRLVTSREGCFLDPGTTKIEASFMCHELRSFELRPDERPWISVRDVSVREREQFAAIGEAVTVKSLQLHSTLLVRIYASSANADISLSDFADRRACGEVTVPLSRLVSRLNGCLYHTWLTVDTAGLRDSIASTGMVAGDNEYESFDQAIANGARQLTQPKICMSLIRSNRLPPGGKFVLSDDLPNELRVENWASLLRSQQQHVVMCKALYLQGAQPQDSLRAQAELALLQNQLEMSRSEIERLGSEVTSERSRAQELERTSSQRSSDVDRLRAKLSELETQEPEALRQRQAEVRELQRELQIISEEANNKIDAANERIREIKRERDEALQALQAERGQVQAIQSERGQQQQQSSEEILQLRRDHDRGKKDIERLTSEKTTLEEKHRQVTERIGSLEHQLHEKTLELSKQQNQMKGLEGTIKVKHEQSVSASAQKAAREAEVEELRSREKQHTAQIEQLNARILQLETTGSDARKSCQESQGELISMRTSVERHKSDVNVLREKLEQVSLEANNKIDEANERIRTLRREREEALQENDRLCAESARLTASFQAETSQFECLNASLRAQLQELKDQQGAVLDQDSTEVVTLRLQCAQQKDELEALRRELQVLREQGKIARGAATDQATPVTSEVAAEGSQGPDPVRWMVMDEPLENAESVVRPEVEQLSMELAEARRVIQAMQAQAASSGKVPGEHIQMDRLPSEHLHLGGTGLSGLPSPPLPAKASASLRRQSAPEVVDRLQKLLPENDETF